MSGVDFLNSTTSRGMFKSDRVNCILNEDRSANVIVSFSPKCIQALMDLTGKPKEAFPEVLHTWTTGESYGG